MSKKQIKATLEHHGLSGRYRDYWQLPADDATYEKMVEQIAKVFACDEDDGRGNAIDALQAIGITQLQ